MQAAERAVAAGGEVNIESFEGGEADSSCCSSSSSDSDSDTEEPKAAAGHCGEEAGLDVGIEHCSPAHHARVGAGVHDGGGLGSSKQGTNGHADMEVDTEPQQQQQTLRRKKQAKRQDKPLIQEL